MAFWLTRCLAECLKTISSFFSLPTLPLFIFTSSPTFTPLSFFPPSLRNRDSPVSLFPSLWLGALDSSLHAFQGPEAFGKTSRLFQSNKERQVRVIQICDASKQTSCTQLLWWITKTKRNIESRGGGGPPSWMKASPSAWCQEDERLGGTATWHGCHLFMLPLNVSSLSLSLFPRLIGLVLTSLELLNVSPLCFYGHLPDVLIEFSDKPLKACWPPCSQQEWDCACFHSTSHKTAHQPISLCSRTLIEGAWSVSNKFELIRLGSV